MDENNAVTREESGVSLSEIFRVIAVQKWLALIITVVIAIAGTLTIYYGYNRMKQRYIVEFSLVLPGIDTDSAVYTYPDGKIFQYADMVSREALADVKESSAAFSGIDVDTIVTKGNISVTRSVSATTNEVWYKISVNADCFPSTSTAAEFLKAVVNVPRQYVAEMLVNYDVYLSQSLEAEDYERQIELLQTQLDYITGQYNKLINNFGENVVVSGGTLSSLLNEITSYANKNDLGMILTKVKNDGILKNADLVAKYELQKVEYERQLGIAQATLNTLLSGSETGTQGNVYLDASVIKTQSDLVETLKQKISDLDKYIEKGEGGVDAEFEKNFITPQYEILKGYTDGLNEAVVEIYDKSSSVAYMDAGGMRAEGGMGLTMSFALSLIVGIIIALIVAYIVGKRTLLKRAVKENSAVNVMAMPAVGEAAATSETEDDTKNK